MLLSAYVFQHPLELHAAFAVRLHAKGHHGASVFRRGLPILFRFLVSPFDLIDFEELDRECC